MTDFDGSDMSPVNVNGKSVVTTSTSNGVKNVPNISACCVLCAQNPGCKCVTGTSSAHLALNQSPKPLNRLHRAYVPKQ